MGCTHDNTGPGEHLAQAGSGVDGEGALEVVLGVEASVVVGTGLGSRAVCLRRSGSGLGSRHLDHGGGLGGGLRRSKQFEARHVSRGEGLKRRREESGLVV